MKETPILFTGEMVRAILDGRKTQTRRTVKAKEPIAVLQQSCGPMVLEAYDDDAGTGKCVPCPYGIIGSRLWVKETFQPVQLASEVTQWRYRATDEKGLANWKPSIFMPRYASRITLEITRVRVERLQQITELDAQAEGVQCGQFIASDRYWPTYKDAYETLWNKINGDGSWAKNPWVWVLEFKRI